MAKRTWNRLCARKPAAISPVSASRRHPALGPCRLKPLASGDRSSWVRRDLCLDKGNDNPTGHMRSRSSRSWRRTPMTTSKCRPSWTAKSPCVRAPVREPLWRDQSRRRPPANLAQLAPITTRS